MSLSQLCVCVCLCVDLDTHNQHEGTCSVLQNFLTYAAFHFLASPGFVNPALPLLVLMSHFSLGPGSYLTPF